jgi:hypothetical protein
MIVWIKGIASMVAVNSGGLDPDSPLLPTL